MYLESIRVILSLSLSLSLSSSQKTFSSSMAALNALFLFPTEFEFFLISLLRSVLFKWKEWRKRQNLSS
jgi:hypothetical protein